MLPWALGLKLCREPGVRGCGMQHDGQEEHGELSELDKPFNPCHQH